MYGKREREDLAAAYVPRDEAMLVPVAITDKPPTGAASRDALHEIDEARESREAFEALITEHLPGLRARAAQLCRCHMEAEDLLQEALIRAFRAWKTLRERGFVRAWLLRIVANTFYDALRKERVRPQLVPLEPELVAAEEKPTETLPWEHIGTEELCAAIERLPDDVRDTYRLFAIEAKDYAEIAAMLHIAKATVGTRLLRARKRLRVLLAAALEGQA